MDRKIKWETGLMDEIGLVYEKAENNADIAAALECLEEQALEEVRLSALAPSGSGAEKELAIKKLAAAGFGGIGRDMDRGVIFIRLSAHIPQTMACTVFEILNRLEKLDGSLNMLKPKWTLELQVPLGGRKGLFRWEMLMMQLYPWISVRETATREPAEEMPGARNAGAPGESTEAAPASGERRPGPGSVPAGAAAGKGEEQAAKAKTPFWKKLFGK